MAELVLSALLPVLFERLASTALKNIARDEGIDAEIKKWQSSLKQIERVLADASRKEITDDSVKEWLKDLQHLAYDIDDVLDGWVTEAMCGEFTHDSGTISSKVRKLIPTCCTNFSRNTKMLAQLDEISTKLQDLVKQKDDFGLRVEVEPRPKINNNNRRLQSSVVDPSGIVGRQAEKDALVQELLAPAAEPCDQNYSIVPIVGMGGVGKTTLARLVYDENKVKDHFELKAWVCVSDEFDSFRISKDIFEAIAMVNQEFTNFNLLHEALRDHIRGKRFIFVLDDVWSESYEDWKTLVAPFHACALGSKVVITTRKDQLLKQLVYNPLNKQLHSLLDDDALCLFARHALGVDNFDSHSSLKPYAQGIVKKCGGLPLALITLGRLLRTKKDQVGHWKEVSNSEIWKLKDEGGILPALRISYHDLSAPLKQLFAYCSLFPKDFLFNKEEIVLLWMAEGFLHPSTLSDSIEESLGHEFFEELLSRSFFQHAPNNESLFVMHDLMNDLATSVSREFFVRVDNEAEKNIKKTMLEKYRHMSFVREKYVPNKKFEAFARAKRLRTFLATSVGVFDKWDRFYMSNKVLVDLFRELSLLRVLCLSNFEISEVPESIGTLKHLRYINLSRTRITHLPENVCNLYNLEKLILYSCSRFNKLPNGFLKLKNLRHLDIRDTPSLDQMPLEVGELKKLQTLSKIVIEDEGRFKINKLKEFNNLCGTISIEGLDKVENSVHAREANISQKRLSELELVWSDEAYGSRNEVLEKEVLKELKPCNDELIQLKIKSYGGLEFPKWVGDPSFLRLKHVSLRNCKRCTSLPPLGQVHSLKELFIEGLDEVKVVGMELPGIVGVFPSLEILSFTQMMGWEKWSMNSEVVFPCVKQLHVKNCPNLVEVELKSLPLLNVLEIESCDSVVLRRLVEIAFAVTKLEIRDILRLNDVVWRGVTKYLKVLEELSILYCNEIRHLWESEAVASKLLVNLRKLKVRGCENLVRLGEKEEEDNSRSKLLTSFMLLDVYECKNMIHCSCPHGIEKLRLSLCTSVTTISLPTGGQKLKSFCIQYCEKLLEEKWAGEKTNNKRSSMLMLEDVCISGWGNLKSIIGLNYFVHLTSLIIRDCEGLESFPDNELSNLTSLQNLKLTNCPRMDVCIPRGIWPPNLRTLEIGKLNKSISEWGPQNFPASLMELNLYVGECGEFSHHLPSSLTHLGIIGFEKFESFTMGLQHLASLQSLFFTSCPNMKKVSHPHHLHSLQHLCFFDCPEMMDLPAVLLPSLLSLTVGRCPNLEERCKKVSHPLISHIPCIKIGSILVTKFGEEPEVFSETEDRILEHGAKPQN